MAYSKYKKDGTLKQKPGKKPDPNKVKKQATFVKGVVRPHVWKCGPDEYKHSMYTPWMMARAQAKFRDETFELTFEQFYSKWKDCWAQRGRGIDDLCMSRKDFSEGWTDDNAEVIDRREHLNRQQNARSANKDGYYKNGLPGPKGPWKHKIQYKKMKAK